MRWIFQGTGGFIGRIEGETRISFWPDEPADHDFDPSRLIAVDLARTPSAAAAGEIEFDAVEVDDCFSGPNGDVRGTTLGPRWPEIQLTGAVYLEQRFRDRLPAEVRPALPPKFMGGRPYEYMTALYWPGSEDPRAGKRYAGHHAQILEERGTLAKVTVYPQGSSDRPTAEPTHMWIDLSSPDQTDAGPNAVSVRLLGCETTVSPSGQRTLRMLADILGIPVFGSRKRLSKTHHTATGFNPLFANVLIEAAPSRSRSRPGPFGQV